MKNIKTDSAGVQYLICPHCGSLHTEIERVGEDSIIFRCGMFPNHNWQYKFRKTGRKTAFELNLFRRIEK